MLLHQELDLSLLSYCSVPHFLFEVGLHIFHFVRRRKIVLTIALKHNELRRWG
jgi:hypothetical protein